MKIADMKMLSKIKTFFETKKQKSYLFVFSKKIDLEFEYVCKAIENFFPEIQNEAYNMYMRRDKSVILLQCMCVLEEEKYKKFYFLFNSVLKLSGIYEEE